MNRIAPGIARSVTKTISIDRDCHQVFAYLANLENWPQWAIVNVKAVQPRQNDEWWDMLTPNGPATLRMRANAHAGILDHDFRDPVASWTVPARVVANGTGAEFMMTFFQPPAMASETFDFQIQLIDSELTRLKEILETA